MFGNSSNDLASIVSIKANSHNGVEETACDEK